MASKHPSYRSTGRATALFARASFHSGPAEVTHVSTHCFLLLLGDEELAVPFSEFPWFKKATIEQLCEVQRPTEDHLYWPQLDVDLSVESILKLEGFPLVSRSAA